MIGFYSGFYPDSLVQQWWCGGTQMLRHTAGDTGRNVKATVSSRCTSAGSWCNPALEAELGLKLNHPHIVKTLAVRSRPTMGVRLHLLSRCLLWCCTPDASSCLIAVSPLRTLQAQD